MRKVLLLTNSSGGLYDFRNEFVLALLGEYQVYISMPDDVNENELAAQGLSLVRISEPTRRS